MTATQLTGRERDVLALMAEGLTNRQIAGRLSLEPGTVRWYVRQIHSRLGAENREEALTRARDLGLIASPAQSPPPPHNLPAPTTPFVGRTAELARLQALLADPAVRLVTIAGPGGMGKTRLALAAAEVQLRPYGAAGAAPAYRYPDGVWFVPLSAVSSARYLAPAFADALGLQLEMKTGREPLAQLLDYLKQKRALLVADNFEQLIDEAAFLATIAAGASSVQILVTSRERLQLPGEQVLALDGLEMPRETPGTLAGLAGSPAARLLLNTARRVQPDLALAEADASAVARICQAVAGMPLGIELAASWASVLPLAEIARELEGSLELLAADWRGIPDRHRSMEAALLASWQRLTTSQQAAFQQLCLFRGGFTRATAYAVASTTLPLLVTLVNKSWLAYDPGGDRYHIHELLRQFGQRLLAEAPALERAARARFSSHYAAWLEQGTPNFTGASQVEWVAEMRTELANIQEAWNWAVEAGEAGQIRQALESLARFYSWTGRAADGEAALSRAAARLAGLAKLPAPEPDAARIWARTLIWLGRLSHDPERHVRLLDEAQAVLARLPPNDPDLRADWALLLYSRGWAVFDRDRRAAAGFVEQALALYQALGDAAGEAACLADLGWGDWARGRLAEAVRRFEASLAIRRQLGDRRGIAHVLGGLALVHKHQGHWEQAESLQREALQSQQRLGSPADALLATTNLAYTMVVAGRHADMLALAQQAAVIAKELGEPYQADPAIATAVALQHQGRYTEALALYQGAAQLARAAGLSQSHGFALLWRGQVACALGDYGQAEQWLAEAEAIFFELQQNVSATPAAWLSYTYRAQGDAARAKQQFERALRVVLERQSVVALLDCLPVAALLAADRGDLERAAELHALGQSFPYLANSRWFADVAGRELNAVVARLPAEVAEAASRRGRDLDLWATAEALLAEFAEV